LFAGPYGGPTRSTRHTRSLTAPNALRDNGKKAVLVLKGAKAPAWLTEGVPYLKKDETKDPPKEPAK